MVRIAGFCATETNHHGNGKPITTSKAVRVTVHTVDGEGIQICDTTWLPRSICTELAISKYELDTSSLVDRLRWLSKNAYTALQVEKLGLVEQILRRRGHDYQ